MHALTTRRLRYSAAALTGAAVLGGAAFLGIPALDAAPAPAPPGGWRATPVPLAKGDLTAVSALSDTNAWAVGYQLTGTAGAEDIAEHVALRWDGRTWTKASTLPNNMFPQVLAARSDTDVWVSGSFAAHWDGTTWTPRPLEPDPAGRVRTDGIALGTGGTAWLAGQALAMGGVKTGVPAVQKWDGTAWRRQALPDTGKGELLSIVAVADDDVWAAGVAYAAGADAPQQSLLLHFDGSTWTRVAAPAAGTSWIGALTALGPDDVWAVGGKMVDGVEHPYALHWDGSAWKASATPKAADGRLRGVGRNSRGELWAVGGKGAVSVALRWNRAGTRWEQTRAPDLSPRAFSTVPGSAALWTVGLAKRGDLVPAAARQP